MLYITGDTHGSWDKREEFIRSLSKEDILITLGDWGWCWTPLYIKWYLENNPKCIQLWIDGNHEGYHILETFPIVEIYGGRAHKIADNIYHLIRGEMYNIEGKKFFVFGGALSIDKHWRTPYVSWWPQEQPTEADYYNAIGNLQRNNWTFDYLLTHTADTELVQKVLGRTDTINDSTERMISQLKYEIKENGGSFKKHFFGHLHQFWKGVIDDYEWYCLYTQIYDMENDRVTFYDDRVFV